MLRIFFSCPFIDMNEAKNQIFYALCGRWNWWIRECLDETNLLPWFSFAITSADFYPYVKKWINNLEVRVEPDPDTLAVWETEEFKTILYLSTKHLHICPYCCNIMSSPVFTTLSWCPSVCGQTYKTSQKRNYLICAKTKQKWKKITSAF